MHPKSAIFELARLLLDKNLRKPKAERNWTEITSLIGSLEAMQSDQLNVALLKADLYFAQGEDDKATGNT